MNARTSVLIGGMRGAILASALAIAGGGAACAPAEPPHYDRPPSGATFRSAVEQVIPAVVSINVEASPAGPVGLPRDHPLLDELFPPERAPRMGAGSGVLIGDGYILTSDHVIHDATRVQVTLHDRRVLEALVVARDPSTDIAVLRVEGDALPAARLGDSAVLEPGDWVLAVGSPLGLQFTVTAGVVSAKGRAIGILGTIPTDDPSPPLEYFIQTDAAINPGNSGGPLVNLAGEVIGINTAISSPTGLHAGYGFAVPISLARQVAEQLIRHGHVRRPYLGVLLQDATAADAAIFDLPAPRGATVKQVQEDSPAQAAGVQVGDVVVALEGQEIATANDLQALLASHDPGTVRLRVIRYGEELELPVRVAVLRTGFRPEPPPAPEPEVTRLGFSVAQVQGRTVVGRVVPFSGAAQAGIRSGQVVLEVNRRPVRTITDFAEALTRVEGDVYSLTVVDPQLGRTIVNFEVRS
jgi:serine protease Do